MENIKNNINNLTNLWTIASKPFNGFATDYLISYCQINNSEWPNRIWTTQQLSIRILQSIKEITENSDTNLKFVNFENLEANNTILIESLGFKLTSSLPGMSLKLNQYFPKSTRIKLEMVTNKAEAKKWSSVFKEAFGYLISAETVLKSMHKTNYYLIYDKKTVVATIVLHQTNNIAGIHSLGVLPNMRGKGYAKEIMHYILNEAIKQGATQATLQASSVAKKMYEKLGFKTDFTMNNYELKTL
jgi:ribosomal protein S18 acetylase RimI-like enzyme